MQGVYTALVTPFDSEGKVSFRKLEELVERNIKAGVDGLVIGGTTAETPAITESELKEICAVARSAIAGRTKFIVGAGTNATVTTVEKIRALASFRPDAILTVTPYYNKPNASGLLKHFRAVDSCGLPIILYHIPGRTGLKLSPAQLFELFDACPNIVAVKEANSDIEASTDLLVGCPDRVSVLAGNDDLFPHYLALGAKGIISAAGNLLAPVFVKIQKHFQRNEIAEARDIFKRAYPFIKAVYLETNPVCLKYLMNAIGCDVGSTRLPLDLPSEANRKKLDELVVRLPREFTI